MIGVKGRDRMRLSPTFAPSDRGRQVRDMYDLASIKQTNDPDSEYWRARKKYFSVSNTDTATDEEEQIEWPILGPILAYVSLFCIMKVSQSVMPFKNYIDSSFIQCVRSLSANYPRLHRLATSTCPLSLRCTGNSTTTRIRGHGRRRTLQQCRVEKTDRRRRKRRSTRRIRTRITFHRTGSRARRRSQSRSPIVRTKSKCSVR